MYVGDKGYIQSHFFSLTTWHLVNVKFTSQDQAKCHALNIERLRGTESFKELHEERGQAGPVLLTSVLPAPLTCSAHSRYVINTQL